MCWVAWSRLAKSKKAGGLGFREIEQFNDALLAKQSWRILNNPNCLLARVLRGKYMKHEGFLSCSAPPSASHGWRGIITGRDLIKKRLGKVIGSGESTPIWTEPWISLSESIVPIGPPTKETANLRVVDLIDPFTKRWDLTKVREILPAFEEHILKLKPSRLGAQDKYVWLSEKSGEYTTRSGYHCTVQDAEGEYQEEETRQNIDGNATVWNRKTSPKIQMFLWKILQGALPIGENLVKRGIQNASQCIHCGERETTSHIFLHCHYAQQVWNRIPTRESVDSACFAHFMEGLQASNHWIYLPPSGIRTQSLFPWVCWSLWNARNKLFFEERGTTVEDSVTKAVKEALEWQTAQEKQTKTTLHPKKHPGNIIEKQQEDTIACYTDGAWKVNSPVAGIGCWFRNSCLHSIKEVSTVRDNVASPLMAEALALLEAVLCAKRQGWKHVQFFSDSQTLIKAINSEAGNSELYGILQDLLAAKSFFDHASFSFIPRIENTTADHLAKAALSSVFDSHSVALG